jgi:hypothetical protein
VSYTLQISLLAPGDEYCKNRISVTHSTDHGASADNMQFALAPLLPTQVATFPGPLPVGLSRAGSARSAQILGDSPEKKKVLVRGGNRLYAPNCSAPNPNPP